MNDNPSREQILTKREIWKNTNRGPYFIFRMTILFDDNPFKDLDYVYYDGWIMASDPGQIDVIVSIPLSVEFAKIAFSRGYNAYAWKVIQENEFDNFVFD